MTAAVVIAAAGTGRWLRPGIQQRLNAWLRRADAHAEKGVDCRCDLPDQMSHHCQVNGDDAALFHPDVGNEKDQCHADDLLDDLGEGRDLCFLHAVIIAVDAGVKRRKRHGNPHKREIGRTLRFHQDIGGEKYGVTADQVCQHKGHDHGQGKPGGKYRAPFFHVGGYVLGQRRLDGTGAKCKADAKYRVDHIVDAEPFRADGAGEEYAVKEAKDAAGKARAGQEKRAGEEGALFFGQVQG